MQHADRLICILNLMQYEARLQQKVEFASAGGIPHICRIQCARVMAR